MNRKTNQNREGTTGIVQIVQFINSVFLMVSGILILWIWFNLMTDDGFNMFLGLVGLPLFIVTIYYMALIIWGIKLFIGRQNNLTDSASTQSIIIFFMNLLPMVLIYYFTS
ncbi:MAG: hypothetical protein H7329_12330 [Opitutaceae bacterium]|nr:hypothetical protein [Cytophagales bacterium]